MSPIEFPEANKTLTAPPDLEGCMDLPVFNDRVASVSCWQPTPDELDEINATGKVWLSVFAGESAPPVWVSGHYPFITQEQVDQLNAQQPLPEPEPEPVPGIIPTDPAEREAWIKAFNARMPGRDN